MSESTPLAAVAAMRNVKGHFHLGSKPVKSAKSYEIGVMTSNGMFVLLLILRTEDVCLSTKPKRDVLSGA